MWRLLGEAILLPFRMAAALIEGLGRTIAIVTGLAGFGFGALLCLFPLFVLIGAPLCLISAIVVVKAL